MTSAKQRRRRDGGFTLVELLVGLALTAVASALLLEVIGTGGSATQRGERTAAAAESVSTVQALLRERIELLSADGDDATGSHRDTQGDSRRFAFVAPSLGNRAGDGLARYLVSLDRHGALDLAVVDARETVGGAARWRVLPLIDDVGAIEWSYFGAGRAGGAPQWQSTWIDREDPPRLVRLRLRFAGGDPRNWPELVVRPATTISTACDLDPTTGTCRAS